MLIIYNFDDEVSTNVSETISPNAPHLRFASQSKYDSPSCSLTVYDYALLFY